MPPVTPVDPETALVGIRDTRILGERLADLPRWKPFFKNTKDIEAVCKRGSTMSTQQHIGHAALMLENEYQCLTPEKKARFAEITSKSLNEDTRSLTVGGFQDMIFGVIRATVPVNPIIDMVNVQPMTRKHGQVFFMHYVAGTNKGQYAAGTRLFDAQRGYTGGWLYSSEFVERELLATATASATLTGSGTSSCALDYAAGGGGGIRPGTVRITAIQTDGSDTFEVRDNGNGKLFVTIAGSQTMAISSGAIDYTTGIVTLVMTAAFGAGPVLASYEYDSEGSTLTPQVDVLLVTSPITARRRALKYLISTEAEQDYSAEFGRDIQAEVGAGIAGMLVTEQAREVLADLWAMAGAPYQSFNIYHVPTSAGYSKREHFGDIIYPLNQVINASLQDTQQYRANWMVVDIPLLNILQTLGAPYFFQFEQSAMSDDTLGVKFVGTWNQRVRVYVDPLLNQFPDASPWGNALLGYKGGDDLKGAAYIWAPYRQLYTTPVVTLEDFVSRKGFASRIGSKAVNPLLVRRFEITYASS